jgi:hypothetical protein
MPSEFSGGRCCPGGATLDRTVVAEEISSRLARLDGDVPAALLAVSCLLPSYPRGDDEQAQQSQQLKTRFHLYPTLPSASSSLRVHDTSQARGCQRRAEPSSQTEVGAEIRHSKASEAQHAAAYGDSRRVTSGTNTQASPVRATESRSAASAILHFCSTVESNTGGILRSGGRRLGRSGAGVAEPQGWKASPALHEKPRKS